MSNSDNLKVNYTRAIEAISDGNLNKAKILLQNLAITDTLNPLYLNDLGVIYFHQSEFEQSIQLFQKALLLDPNFKDALDNLNQILNL